MGDPPDEHNAPGQRTASSPLSLIRPDQALQPVQPVQMESCTSAGRVLWGHMTPAEQI